MTNPDTAATLQAMREALQGDCRIHFATTINLTAGDIVATAQIETKVGARWVKVGPLLLAPDHVKDSKAQRAELLTMLAGLVAETAGPLPLAEVEVIVPEPDADAVEPEPVGGPWTRHGHPVAGVTVAGPGAPKIYRCGGPHLCEQCRVDAVQIRDEARTR